MRNMVLYVITVVVITAVTAICVSFTKDKNIEFLNAYGWKVESKYIEKETVKIPVTFDKMYSEYNELQKQAGLDLSKYRGVTAVRYTYVVKNYPKDVSEVVRANVICVRGEPVAGDIMTVSLGGFMHSLNYPSE